MHRIQIEMTWIDLNINEALKGCHCWQSRLAREPVVQNSAISLGTDPSRHQPCSQEQGRAEGRGGGRSPPQLPAPSQEPTPWRRGPLQTASNSLDYPQTSTHMALARPWRAEGFPTWREKAKLPLPPRTGELGAESCCKQTGPGESSSSLGPTQAGLSSALGPGALAHSSVQPLIHAQLFVTPRTAARQASLSITNSQSLLKLMSIEAVIPSNHLILCRPILPPSVFTSIRIFSNKSVLQIRWWRNWRFSFNISPSNEYSGLISFRMDWLDLLAVQGTLKSLLQHHSPKASILWCSAFFIVQLSHPYMTTGKTIALTRRTFVCKVASAF